MKKFLSLILVLSLVFAVTAPMAFAADDRTPIIYIRGNGEDLFYPDGTRLVASFEDLDLSGGEDGLDKNVIIESVVNILKPFVLEGMIFDKWDNYGRAIYDEISPLFPDSGLDENGNPKKGTAPAASQIDFCDNRLAHSAWEFNNSRDYSFTYDWRLSPYDHLERLHAFITNIMTATGKNQVSIYARCMGGSLLKAYLDEYGHLGHVKNVMFCDVLSNETTVVSKAFSGQIEFDAKLVESYAGQLDFCGRYDQGVGFVFSEILNEIVFKTMDFFNQINVTDGILDGVELLYEKLYKALVPALCHAVGLATQANYWCYVAEEDMDDALNLIFGEEGSELRVKYAGLIEKIQKYRNNVSNNIPVFYDELEKNNIHYGFVGKYGFMNAPFTVDADLLSDSLASLEHATMGATCASVGKTLSENYIAARLAEGKGKYIAPDKQVDLSTCISPDTTWIVKNAHHDIFESYSPMVKAFLNGTKETVDTISEKTKFTQFQVYDYDTNTVSPMTEENCAEFDFITRPEQKPTTSTILAAFMRFFTMILNFFTRLINGELDLGNLFG